MLVTMVTLEFGHGFSKTLGWVHCEEVGRFRIAKAIFLSSAKGEEQHKNKDENKKGRKTERGKETKAEVCAVPLS